MTIREYVDIQRALGEKIVDLNNVYWRRIWPFFYRPILPFIEYSPESVNIPRASFLGGVQHAVFPPEIANSYMNFLMFDDLQGYSSNSLQYNCRRQIKLASKQFLIRPIYEVDELKDKGHKLYLEFYERTNYSYKSKRQKQNHFFAWADTLFRFSKTIMLGGYNNNELSAIGICYLVDDILIYATFFCSNKALSLHVSDLMLHSIRELAAESQNIRYIFTGMYEPKKGTVAFYLFRGCKIIRKPSLYRINWLALFLLRILMPKQYQRLCGNYEMSMVIQNCTNYGNLKEQKREMKHDICNM